MSEPPSPAPAVSGPWCLALALAVAGVAASWQTWADILGVATRDPEASHVLLAPLVLAWLAWTRRADLARLRPGPRWPGPALVATGWLMSYLGFYHAVETLWHLSAVLILLGCLVSATGTGLLTPRLLPLVAALVFCVPIPGSLRQAVAIPLQTAAAVLTQQAFHLLHLEVIRHGNVLCFHGTDVAVAEGCNGVRLITPLVMVIYAAAFARPLTGTVRAVLLLAAPIAALAGNVARLVPTVWLYGCTNASVAGSFHHWSGWMLAPLTLLALIGVLRLLPRAWIESPQHPSSNP